MNSIAKLLEAKKCMSGNVLTVVWSISAQYTMQKKNLNTNNLTKHPHPVLKVGCLFNVTQ